MYIYSRATMVIIVLIIGVQVNLMMQEEMKIVSRYGSLIMVLVLLQMIKNVLIAHLHIMQFVM